MENFVVFEDVNGPFLNYPYAVHTQSSCWFPTYNMKQAPYKGQKNPKYATMVENLDRNIGLLVDKLKKRKFFDNTFVIFTSDNGGYYGKITKQKPLRAGKGSYYEGGTRVPFFFMWKNKISPGKNIQTPISHLDIFPTLMHLNGDDSIKKDLAGHSLLPLLAQNQVCRKTFSGTFHLPSRL